MEELQGKRGSDHTGTLDNDVRSLAFTAIPKMTLTRPYSSPPCGICYRQDYSSLSFSLRGFHYKQTLKKIPIILLFFSLFLLSHLQIETLDFWAVPAFLVNSCNLILIRFFLPLTVHTNLYF